MAKRSNQSLYLRMYGGMLRIRLFEEKAIDLFQAGELPGFLHAYIGEEAVAVGVCSALRPEDHIIGTHRGHGHVLAKGCEFGPMFAELYARRTGYCKGKGGSMHIADQGLGILGANGIVGAGIPIAAGAALAFRLKKTRQVQVAFFGDGAANEGAFHEGINLAATWRLPAVFVCENNLYAESTPQRTHQSIADIADRAGAYDIPGVVVDGQDVLAVHEAADEAVRRARKGEGPTLIEAKTYRFLGHYVGDPGTAYRAQGEVNEWKKRDPIALFKKFLLKEGWAGEKALERVRARIASEIGDAVEFARKSPRPENEEALTDVYARL
ncbi:MAG: thiamine pyrophosphate-dependent dehydrogenase E1 component subunit alpha [Candidatus Tectomicrobia bacterium]|nr:thiamine pyrophosphate-dependent dehydrogenase E1 component subunit alpha [Candidatus Tectomicrobia bacterium]